MSEEPTREQLAAALAKFGCGENCEAVVVRGENVSDEAPFVIETEFPEILICGRHAISAGETAMVHGRVYKVVAA